MTATVNRRFGKTWSLQIYMATQILFEMEHESEPVTHKLQICGGSSSAQHLIFMIAKTICESKFPYPELKLTQEEEDNGWFTLDPKWDKWLAECENIDNARSLFTIKVIQHVKTHHAFEPMALTSSSPFAHVLV